MRTEQRRQTEDKANKKLQKVKYKYSNEQVRNQNKFGFLKSNTGIQMTMVLIQESSKFLREMVPNQKYYTSPNNHQ